VIKLKVTNPNTDLRTTKIKPLLRWAGGKIWMLDKIKELLPTNFKAYHEPFIGGGAVFSNLGLNDRDIYISDINPTLISFYKQVQSDHQELINKLLKYKNTTEFYYKVRNFKGDKTDLDRAADFYYLNRTCFNGLYRVNRSGFFNVPYGHRDIDVLEIDAFVSFNKTLSNVFVSCCDFEVALKKVKKGDFVFLDPPYTVAHNKNGFIEYNQRIFSWTDQVRLASCVKQIMEKGAYFIMTNANHISIKKLYKGVGKQYEIQRHSTVSGNMDSRFKISELVITNCLSIKK